ncbi:ABC transporter ATP-binding protein [Candidatus Woesearchaeota archaeon]|nr:ABC transporter ATP-binding protein [Candidatus Woesearchaeota archaeon]
MVGDATFLVKGVTKYYGSRTILDNLNFEIMRGEILGFIGASGAGKTTLLNILVGFIPSSRGEVCFNPPGKKKECRVIDNQRLVAGYYGFASQHPSFYEKLTVIENLRYFGSMYNLAPETIERNAQTLLHLMSLKSHAHLLGQHLSGGMQRRLDIACALIHNPHILILDEPTADLDPVLRNHIWEVIKKINARGTTVILSSHHLNELDALCNRIAIIKDGKLIDIDSPERLKHKYYRQQEVMIESFPGNYEKIIAGLDLKGVMHKKEGTHLIIRTEKPEDILGKIIPALKHHGESLLDLQLVKPNLDNVFVTIYKDKKPGRDV